MVLQFYYNEFMNILPLDNTTIVKLISTKIYVYIILYIRYML